MKRHHELPFGAEIVEGGVRFRLWAPKFEKVSVAIESGGQIVGGICRGVDANGFLLIDQPSGVRVVASGLGLRADG